MTAAKKLRDLGWEPAADAYDAACALALCVPVVEKDDKASKEERAETDAVLRRSGDGDAS